MGVPITTLHKGCDSLPANWGRVLIMGIKGMHLPDWQLECRVLQYLSGTLKAGSIPFSAGSRMGRVG